jgi:hypothetical protein
MVIPTDRGSGSPTIYSVYQLANCRATPNTRNVWPATRSESDHCGSAVPKTNPVVLSLLFAYDEGGRGEWSV